MSLKSLLTATTQAHQAALAERVHATIVVVSKATGDKNNDTKDALPTGNTLSYFILKRDFRGFRNRLNVIVAARGEAEHRLQHDDAFRAYVQRRWGAPDLYPTFRQFWPMVIEGFITAVNESQPQYVQEILSKQSGGVMLISPAVAYDRLSIKQYLCSQERFKRRQAEATTKKAKTPAQVAAEQQSDDNCQRVIHQLDNYLKAAKKPGVTLHHTPDMPTKYEAMPAKFVHMPAELYDATATVRLQQQQEQEHNSMQLSHARATEEHVAVSGVMYGYGSDQLDFADEQLVLPNEGAVQRRIDRLFRLNDGTLDARPSRIPGAGSGIFVVKHVQAGTMLTEYSGTIVARSAAEHLMHHGHGSHVRALRTGGAWAVHGFTWPGPAAGNGAASLVNDNVNVCDSLLSEDGSLVRFADKPHNCKFAVVTDQANADASAQEFDPKRAHIVLVALRTIRPNEELYADYGMPFWRLELDTGDEERACTTKK